MFDKPKINVGFTFPLLESKDEKISLKYDTIKVSTSSEKIIMTFIQDNVEIYAYTYEVNGATDFIFEGMGGKIDIKFTT